MHSAQQSTVLLSGQSISSIELRRTPQDYQELLRSAREKHGHALCECKTPNLRLVIREKDGKLYLAAWPDEASAHAQGCAFYTSPEHQRFMPPYKSDAITHSAQRTSLQLHHEFASKREVTLDRAKATPAEGQPAQRSTKHEAKERLHLWGLLHYLWEEAGLNRWSKGWSRDWGMARYYLRKTAQSTYVGGVPLIQNIYVPPIWRTSEQVKIEARWNDFYKPLARHHRKTFLVRNGILIGQVKSLDKTQYGYAVRLRHHAAPIYIPEKLASSLMNFSRAGWAELRHLIDTPNTDMKKIVICAMRVEVTSFGAITMTEGCLMRTSAQFIPVKSSFESFVADELVRQDRNFYRPLHYDMQYQKQPSFVLEDTASRIGICVYGAKLNPQQMMSIEAEDQKMCKSLDLEYFGLRVNMDRPKVVLPPQSFNQ